MMAVIGRESGESNLQSVKGYSLSENTWSSLCEMPECRAYCGGRLECIIRRESKYRRGAGPDGGRGSGVEEYR